MIESFRILSPDSSKLIIKEFQLNFWLLRNRNMIIDIGLWFEIDKKYFFEKSCIDLTMHSPFIIKKNKIEDLSEKLRDHNVLQLLLNEDYHFNEIRINHNTVPYIKLKERGKFLIFKSNCFIKNRDEIQISLDKREITEDMIKDYFNGEMNEEKVGAFIRFRYEIDIKKSQNIEFIKKAFRHNLMLDLRFNEIRNSEFSKIIPDIIRIKKVMIFLIIPSSYQVIIENQGRRYVRKLENNWSKYIDFNTKEKLLVYYWKKEEMFDSYNMLISSKLDKSNQLIGILSISVVLASSAYINSVLDLDEVIAGSRYVFSIVFTYVSYGFYVFIGLIGGNFLWDLIKYLVRTFLPMSMLNKFKKDQ